MGRIVSHEGLFSSATSVVMPEQSDEEVDQGRGFARDHTSVRQSFPLETAFTTPVLSFEPDAFQGGGYVDFLPLYADYLDRRKGNYLSRENPVVVPLGLSDYRLNVKLEQQQHGTTLTRVYATPRGATGVGVLHSYSISQVSSNAPAAFRFGDDKEGTAELDLVVRIDGRESPSTFMIAPQYGMGDGQQKLMLSRDKEEYVHGIVPGAAFSLTQQCQLQCGHSTHGNVFGEPVESELVFDMTLPALLEPKSCGFNYPRPGQVYVAGSIGGTGTGTGAVDVWKFRPESSSGQELVLPMLPLSMVAVAGLKLGEPGFCYLSDANSQTVAGLAHSIAEVQHETFMREGPAPDAGDQNSVIRLKKIYVDNPPLINGGGNRYPGSENTRVGAPLEVVRSSSASEPKAERNRLIVREHPIFRGYGPIKIRHKVRSDTLPDYFILESFSTDSYDKFKEFPKLKDISSWLATKSCLMRIGGKPEREITGMPDGFNPRPAAILKLSADISLEEIFQKENLNPTLEKPLQDKDFLREIVDPTVLDPQWVGLIMFNLPLNLDKFPILRTIVGDELSIRYLAVAPEKTTGTNGARKFSYTARVKWVNSDEPEELPPYPPGDERNFEATFTAREVDIAWRANELVNFVARAEVRFLSALGISNQADEKLLRILGSYDKNREKFQFLGQLSEKFPIIDDGNEYGPIKQIYVKGVEIVRSRGRTMVEFDGEVDCRPIKFTSGGSWEEWFKYPEGANTKVTFRGLGLEFPEKMLGGKLPQWMRFNYPSFKLDPNFPQFSLFGLDWLQLKVQNIGVDFRKKFDWDSLIHIAKSGELDNGALLMDVRLNFGKLPDLIANSIKELAFDFTVGVGFEGKESRRISNTKFRIGVKVPGFKKLNLDLMRFLVLRADELLFSKEVLDKKEVGGVPVSVINLTNVRLSIVGTKIIDGMTLSLMGTPNGQQAVLAFFGGGDRGKPAMGIVGLQWVLVGRNLMIPDELVERILSIESASTIVDNKSIAKEISEAVSWGNILPIPDKSLIAGEPDKRKNVGGWLFAAGFDFYKGFAVGKFLFQDNAYYGIAIRGKFLEDWFGWKLALSAIYFKGSRPEEDRLRVALRIPKVDIGPFRFNGGVIALEVVMNGGFMLDIGFPWLDRSGSRKWGRTFGAIITPFQGSSGAYFTYRRSDIVCNNDNESVELIQLQAGYAVQGGLGGGFNGGVFRVWVRAGIYYIIEGAIVLEKQTPRGLRLVGAIGILVEGRGELNWWLVSVSVGLRVTAEARLTLAWGLDPDTLDFDKDIQGDIYVQLNFTLHARVEARACIGSGPFKICKGITVSITIPYKQRIMLK